MKTERERLHNLFPDLDFDPEALRERYRIERDKRIRADGEDQYIEAASQFAHYAEDDPDVDPDYERASLQLDIDVAAIGAGFSGLMTGARLNERGITDFRIIEAGGDFGGTWYWNRYPGAQCDIESYCYLPLLEETGYMPKEKYAFAPEMYEHTQRVSRRRRIVASTSTRFGRGGQSLYEHWANGFRTLHGLSSHGLPNWFTIGINQSGLSPNMEQCTPGYYNREGKGTGANMRNSPYAPGINAFNALLEGWRESGKLEGMELD